MAVHGIGSFSEHIVVSDEEDAAFVENQVSRITDCSSSSTNYSPYGNNTLYLPKAPSLPSPALAPATPTSDSPVLGRKRKWTDMRDSIQVPQLQHPVDNSNSKQKKKKQCEEPQVYEGNPISSAIGGPSKQHHRSIVIHPNHDVSRTPHPEDYLASLPIMHLPYDVYQAAGFPFSSTEEYRPRDGPLWSIGEQPSTLSPCAAPCNWFPPYVPPMFRPEPLSYPSCQPSPPPTTAASSPDLACPLNSQVPRKAPLTPISVKGSVNSRPCPHPFSPSPTLLHPALPRVLTPQVFLEPPFPPMPPHSSHPPIRRQTDGSSSYALPAKPPVSAPVALKRMIGIPDDKCNSGHFDLTAAHLEPCPPAKVAPPIPAHTIVLAEIPKKFCNVQFVRPWANCYGNALRISLDVRAGKALVEWGSVAAAEAAFTGMRLYGDGKEHIRAYRYISVVGANLKPKEIEEGEIEEEVEVVETGPKKKKKKKGKKAHPEQRLPQPVAPTSMRMCLPVATPLPVPPPVAAPPPLPHHDSPPHLPPAPPKDETIYTAADVAAILAAIALRPVLEGSSQSLPAMALVAGVGEEAMELDSDGDERKAPLPTNTATVPSRDQAEAGVVKVESQDGGVVEEDIEDEDMELSPLVPLIPEPSPPSRSPRPSDSNGLSESTEPSTPVDAPSVNVDVDAVMVDSDDVQEADVVAETKPAMVTLDELAVSFITESIQAVSTSTSSSSLSQSPATSSTTMLASMPLALHMPNCRPNAVPIVAPVPTVKVTVMQQPPIPTGITLTKGQQEAKQKNWLELVSESSSLFQEVTGTKNKEEQRLLMRTLKSKTKAADELKREIDSGFALSTTTPARTSSAISSSLSLSLSATPMPVPFSHTPSVTPVPTPSGTPPTRGYFNITQKRWPSPPIGKYRGLDVPVA